MQRKPVNSSNILSIGYDQKNKILEIEFKNNAVWHYSPVEFSVFDGLKNAMSVGKYFFAHIRGKYSESRIS